MTPVLFVDRDGTLIEEPEDFQVDSLRKLRLVSDVVAALQQLVAHGYRLVMVSNQDGLGTHSFPQGDFDAPQEFMLTLFASQGIDFDEVFICPHLPEDGCNCRKPAAGLLTRYLASTNIDLQRSAVVGDRETDLQLAENIGIRGFRVNADSADSLDWPSIAGRLCGANRIAQVERKTRETAIVLSVNLDATMPVRIDTGIGFFDHMLEQVAKHAGFALEVNCRGDLDVDEHHTVEDVAICLGDALRQALGNKYGIGRYGFTLPMDESCAQVAVDLSGRSAFRFDGEFARQSVGGLSTEMVEHFFRSLSESLRCALHIQVSGENTHHMIEACFKAVGRALRPAVAKGGSELPSTKGTLAS